MRLTIYTFIVFTTLWLSCCSMAIKQSGLDNVQIDTTFIKETRDYDTIGLEVALREWKLDSMGCLQLRTVGMADYLVKELGIKGKPMEEAIALLGMPNERSVYKDWLYDREDTFLFLTYFIGIPCVDGKPVPRGLNHCWLRLQVDTTTHQVVSVIAPCS